MAFLILVRHGVSEWNKLGKWTGQTDVSLAEEGLEEARRAGDAIKDIQIDAVHVSMLKRAHETFQEMKGALGRELVPKRHAALNERHYGVHTGKNKWEVKKEIGEEEFQRIRRSWDHLVEGGETMKDVYNRIVPYYTGHIVPELLEGKNVLVVAHGNSLRALVKYLENMSDEAVGTLEFGTGEVFCYEVDGKGKIKDKTIRATNPEKLKI